jgi:predicted dehydrogenase
MIRWGILGTGLIASAFAEAVKHLPDAQVTAVGSRSQDSADRFGEKYNIPHRHPTYEGLAHDSQVDAIYISTPHPMHKDNMLLCLNAGKAVLCEKPFTMNAAEAKIAIDLAREKKLFLMEAMWTRYIPAMVKVRELLASGAIGDVRMLIADFGFRAPFDPAHRLFAPELGGGSLLDVGVYVVSLASMVFGGAPSRVTADAELGLTGTDDQMAAVFGYANGALAMLSSAVRTETPQEAIISGTEGVLRIHRQWWRPQRLTITRVGQADEHFEIPYAANGYQYEAAEVGRCLEQGLLESPVMPLDETMTIMETLDRVRAVFGLVYPFERE